MSKSKANIEENANAKMFSYRLEDVFLSKINIHSAVSEIEKSDVKFDFSTAVQFNDQNGYLIINLRVRAHYDIEDIENDLFEAETITRFHFREHKAVIQSKPDDNSFNVDKNLLSSLIGISYSTTRGLLIPHTQGIHAGVILPIINPAQFVDNKASKSK